MLLPLLSELHGILISNLSQGSLEDHSHCYPQISYNMLQSW